MRASSFSTEFARAGETDGFSAGASTFGRVGALPVFVAVGDAETQAFPAGFTGSDGATGSTNSFFND